jgi:Cu-Zn family superoxide dismutase
MNRILSAAFAATILSVGSSAAQDSILAATATLKNAEGEDIGQVTLTQTPAGVLIEAQFSKLPAGEHAFHLHETGACEPPFESAGGHYNPTNAEHGVMVVGGAHAGDMPNLHVPDSGAAAIEMLNSEISLEDGDPETLFDDDGTSLVVHAGADDYQSQPSGSAGDRIACGVVEKGG